MPGHNSRRKLVFHIGHHKTGTTTIQYGFATGRIDVADKKILYPATMSHNYLAREFARYIESGHATESFETGPSLPEISRLLAREDYDYAVFSAEDFEGANPAEFGKVLDRFFVPNVTDHTVMCYVRPHAARILSSFAEMTKLGATDGSVKAFHQQIERTQRLRYTQKLGRWQTQFGTHFVARPMVRDVLKNGSLIEDFVEKAFDPGLDVSLAPGGSANESLSLEDLALLRHLQGRLAHLGKHTRHSIGWSFLQKCGMRGPQTQATKLALDKETAELIRKTYLSDARALDAGLFAETPIMERELERAVDTAIAKPQSLALSDFLSPDAVRAIDLYADMTLELLDENQARVRDRLRQRRFERLHGEVPSDGPGHHGWAGEKTSKEPGARKRKLWPIGPGYKSRLKRLIGR